MAVQNSAAAAPAVTSTSSGCEAVAAGGHRLAQQRVAEVVAVAEQQLVEVEVEAQVAQPPVGHRALGEVVGDRVVAELLGRLDLDGHPSVAHAPEHGRRP